MTEHQNVEYKESWRDEYLKWICGFANAQGGKIYLGITDKGTVTGLSDYKKLMEDIPNKIVNHLGLVVDVNLRTKNKLHYIEISVLPTEIPISYHGNYHYRSGSTKQELKGTALHQFLLKKLGLSWEQRPIPEASLKDIDEDAVESFIKKATQGQRLSKIAAQSDTLTLLKNLDLVNENGELLLASLLLFGKKPTRFVPGAYIKIGRFGQSEADLKFQDIIEGNILDMADKVMDMLEKKYLIRPISYQRLQRMEPLEYPEPALREALLNAIIHRDYSDATIFVSIYDDKLMIWNPGKLPDSWTIEKLKGNHPSLPRNRRIAEIFFKTGYIESWGRGIRIILDSCKKAALPEPLIEEHLNGISITFLKDIYTEAYLQGLGLGERQVKTILFAKTQGWITNNDYQTLFSVSRNTASGDLKKLVELNLLVPSEKRGAGSYYSLR